MHWDYDKLLDLAENHRALRSFMEVGEFDEMHFSWKRIRDNVCLRQPTTIEEINQLIVAAGHTLAPNAVKRMRADSFVVETNIHFRQRINCPHSLPRIDSLSFPAIKVRIIAAC